MTLTDTLLPELDHEGGATRRVLARVPEAHHGWRPHPRSFSLGELAVHLAQLPTWGRLTLEQQEFDMDNPSGVEMPPAFTETAALLARFDENMSRFRGRLAGASDGELLVSWTLKKDGAPVFTMPRVSVLRSMVLNHAVHHRGQLTVYLRMLEVPIPALYGPSADER